MTKSIFEHSGGTNYEESGKLNFYLVVINRQVQEQFERFVDGVNSHRVYRTVKGRKCLRMGKVS